MPVVDLAIEQPDADRRGRAARAGPQRRPGLLAQTGGQRRDLRGRLAAHGRHRAGGRRRPLYIVDRKKDMINRGGENVYSIEVENVLANAPGGRRSSGPGGARRHDGREGRRRAGCRPGEPDRHRRGAEPLPLHLADFKVPQYISIREDPLPRNSGGQAAEGPAREKQWTPTARRAMTADAESEGGKRWRAFIRSRDQLRRSDSGPC